MAVARCQGDGNLRWCMYRMLKEEIDTDVIFEFPSFDPSSSSSVIYIRAHRYMLKARSPVFEAMFSGPFTESCQNVTISDIDDSVFTEVLRYIYTDKADITSENVMELVFAAKKYLLAGLEKMCSDFLEDEIDDDSICMILNHSLLFNDQSLTESCIEYMEPRVLTIIESGQFDSLEPDALLKVLKSNRLLLTNEADIYEACVDWAAVRQTEAEQNNKKPQTLREILGKCLFEIRFLDMCPPIFATRVDKHSSVLTTEEKNTIYRALSTREAEDIDNLTSAGFNITSRLELSRIKRFSTKKYGWPAQGRPEYFFFTVNKPLMVRGIRLYGGRVGAIHRADIEVVHFDGNSKENTLIKHSEKLTTTSEGNSPPVYFEPVRIEQKEKYIIVTSIEGPQTFYGTQCTGQSQVGDITVTFPAINRTHVHQQTSTNTYKQGQVSEILFHETLY